MSKTTQADGTEKKQAHPDSSTTGIDLAARSRARRRALQALYALIVSGNPLERVIEHFRAEQDMAIADLDYFESLVRGVVKNQNEIDLALKPHLDREVEAIDPIERCVMRIATYELIHRLDVPYRVVINEAIEVSKRFGAEHGHTYVNGVIDKLALAVRALEYRR